MRASLLKQLHKNANTYPDAIALDIDRQVLTYRELWQLSYSHAHELKRILGTPQKASGNCHRPTVALHFHKSNEFVVAQIACWIAGIAFLPLDIDWPEQRKHLAIKTAKCHLLAFSEDSTVLTKLLCETANIPSFSISTDPSTSESINTIDVAACSHDADECLAYTIFTSGSTGEPKGIAVSFSGLTSIIQQQISTINCEPLERTLWLHHVCFDASIADIWVTLLAGSTLVADTTLNPVDILEYVEKHYITYVDLPASLMPLLLPEKAPCHLKTMLVGGEVISLDILKVWCQQVRLVIAYGPSEASICTSMHVFTGSEEQSGYIGKPIDGIEYFVVDENDQQCAVGELIIAGKGVALGYLNASAKNQARFFHVDNQRCYRTGDLVQKTHSNYRFIGRVDRQFKLNGKLICPEEIENVLLNHPQVYEAYVFLNHKQTPAKYCIGISTPLRRLELIAWMKAFLPLWMCSPHWLFLESLPRNVNNKIDQFRLLEQCEKEYSHKNRLLSNSPFISLIQKYSGQCIKPKMYTSALSIDSVQWLMILLDLRSDGFIVDSTNYYSLINHKDTTVDDLEQSVKNNNNKFYEGKESTALLEMLSHYPPVDIAKNKKGGVDKGAILLTGATGHLGSVLLSELLQTNRQIYCLVRQNNTVLKTLKETFIKAVNNQTLQFIFSDISKPQFGLEYSEWSNLAGLVSDVYHCAADTNVLKPLEQLIATNVTGSHHVIQFCANQTIKRLHYASTLALVVDSNWRAKPVDESNKLSSGCFYGGYAQSKWLAEQLVQCYPYANIFRFGLLIGNPENTDAPAADLFGLHFKSRPMMVTPPDNVCFDFTPTDQAAKLMCLISQHSDAGIYHLHNPNPVSAKLVNSFLSNVDEGSNKWQHEDINDPYRMYKMTDVNISSKSTLLFLSRLNASMPFASTSEIKKYIQAICE